KKLKDAFEKLTSGKQKESTLYINEAKQEATNIKRVEKIIPMILQGVGLHDKYKNC
ncbi:MAG: YdeI/OmpD-associated family protein, partial [Flavobacteriaceae bacterium]